MRTHQKTTELYFHSLVVKYAKILENAKKLDFIEIYFKDKLDHKWWVGPPTLGQTDKVVSNFQTKTGSYKTYGYRIGFLKEYEDEVEWMNTIIHEFTHFYLSLIGHDQHQCRTPAFQRQMKEFVKQERKDWKKAGQQKLVKLSYELNY